MAGMTDIRGFEYDWLARDAVGRIAMLSSAGAGLAPLAFRRDVKSHELAIEALLRGPTRSAVVEAPVLKNELINTWRLVVERGLFAYDADPNGGPYVRVGVPASPVALDELPERLRAVVMDLCFPDLRFEDTTVLRARDIAAIGAADSAS